MVTDICENMGDSQAIIYVNMKLIRDLVKNHHDYVQDSQRIARSDILLVLGQNDKWPN